MVTRGKVVAVVVVVVVVDVDDVAETMADGDKGLSAINLSSEKQSNIFSILFSISLCKSLFDNLSSISGLDADGVADDDDDDDDGGGMDGGGGGGGKDIGVNVAC